MKSGYRATYNLSLTQLQTPFTPDVTYIFVVRLDSRWEAFLIIDRFTLDEEHSLNRVGTERDNRVVLQHRFKEGKFFSGGSDFTEYVNDWSKFPIINH